MSIRKQSKLIQSFSCPLTRTFYETGQSKFFSHLGRAAPRKLQLLNCATTLADLQSTLSNHLAITQTTMAQYSIAINSNYQLYFHWTDDGPTQVAIADPTTHMDQMMLDHLPPIHPGEVLREDYLSPLGMRPNDLAIALHMPLPHIEALLNESRPIDPEMALRLTRYFGGDAQSWLNLQQNYDLKQVKQAMYQTIMETIQPFSSTNNSTANATPHTRHE